ncbi:MAG: MBL fold metallo-hydrolase [Anaerolineae bacterium]|nr:MBL fold metallo-hydrolase [Anaerolineae bacterium]
MITKLKLGLSNAYLIQEKGAILVDTGSPGEEKKIIAALAQTGLSLKDIGLILHTHVHSDHVGSTVALRQQADIPVAFHPADQPLADLGHNGSLTGVGWRGRLMQRFFAGTAFDAPRPTFPLSDGLRLEAYGVAGVVRHTPGHTAGSVSVLLDSGEAIIGDVLMGGYMGGNLLPAKPNRHYFAEDINQVYASLDFLLGQPLHTLYVGHGGPLRVDRVRAAGFVPSSAFLLRP